VARSMTSPRIRWEHVAKVSHQLIVTLNQPRRRMIDSQGISYLVYKQARSFRSNHSVDCRKTPLEGHCLHLFEIITFFSVNQTDIGND